jgi:hypothetical protein
MSSGLRSLPAMVPVVLTGVLCGRTAMLLEHRLVAPFCKP